MTHEAPLRLRALPVDTHRTTSRTEAVIVDVVTQALPDAPLSCGDVPKGHVAHRAVLRP